MARQTPDGTNAPESMLRELATQAQTAWRLFFDQRVPIATKLIPVLALLYLLSPLDLVPDWIPVAGQLDDVAILLIALRVFVSLAPEGVRADDRRPQQADEGPTVTTSYRVKDD
jgi:uncharacterized membrane protein YkvA (DUF1232 family)